MSVIDFTPAMEHPSKHHLSAQSMEIVYNVYKYFQMEKLNRGPLIDVSKCMDRVAAATRISKRAVYRVCKEAKEKMDINGN